MLELDIIIVGAGISGLASAIALSRAGHNVQVSTVGSQIRLNHYKIIK
jgi:monoamine oxidase